MGRYEQKNMRATMSDDARQMVDVIMMVSGDESSTCPVT